jgi:hemoglobin
MFLSRRREEMRRYLPVVLLTLVFLNASLVNAAAQEKSLYDRLGGAPAIQAVASGLVDRILMDKRVNGWFAHAAASPENTNAYKAQLASFLCAGFGGPCKYTGADMVAAHRGRGVTSDAFAAVAEDLTEELDQLKVPAKEKGEVMTIVASLKPSIVQAPAHTAAAAK